MLKKVCSVVGLHNLFLFERKWERNEPAEIFSGCGVQMRHLIRGVDAISAFFFSAVVFWESVWVQGSRSRLKVQKSASLDWSDAVRKEVI